MQQIAVRVEPGGVILLEDNLGERGVCRPTLLTLAQKPATKCIIWTEGVYASAVTGDCWIPAVSRRLLQETG
jgi:hypothetical protein